MGKEGTGQGGVRKGKMTKEKGTRGGMAGPRGAAQHSFLDFCHKVQISPLTKPYLTSPSFLVPALPLRQSLRPVCPKLAGPRTSKKPPRQKERCSGQTGHRDPSWNVSVFEGFFAGLAWLQRLLVST